MFFTALFTIAMIWLQPRYPSTDEWIKKLWYNGILLSSKTNAFDEMELHYRAYYNNRAYYAKQSKLETER